MNWNNTINNNYYNRYKDVESQINYENETAEKIRQYNENMAYQKEQQRLEQQRWEQEMAYQKQQDAIANAQKWASINASYDSIGGTNELNGNNSNSNSNYKKTDDIFQINGKNYPVYKGKDGFIYYLKGNSYIRIANTRKGGGTKSAGYGGKSGGR